MYAKEEKELEMRKKRMSKVIEENRKTQIFEDVENFQEHQNIIFTRTKAGPNTDLYPIFHGGGYDLVPTVFYRLFVE